MTTSVASNYIELILRGWPVPLFQTFGQGQHIDAVYWARLYAEVTASALAGYNGVHKFGGTQNCIYRTGLYALGAANAFVYANIGDGSKVCFFAVFGIQLGCRYVEEIGNGVNGGLTTWRAFINGIARGYGFGIGLEAGKTTLATLSLGQ